MGFPQSILNDVLSLGGFAGSGAIPWINFFVMSCTLLAGDLVGSLEVCMKALGDESGGVPLAQAEAVYEFLAGIDGEITDESKAAVLEYMRAKAGESGGLVKADHLQDPACPKLGSS